MAAETILDEIANRAGWDDQSKLLLALRYIDSQDSDDAWLGFLLVQETEEACWDSAEEGEPQP